MSTRIANLNTPAWEGFVCASGEECLHPDPSESGITSVETEEGVQDHHFVCWVAHQRKLGAEKSTAAN